MNKLAAHKLLHEQRSHGAVVTRLGAHGLIRHREEGCLKLRLPQGAKEAILINTSGGLAGGDQISVQISVAAGVDFAATSQTAERVYRTLGPAAEIVHKLEVERDAHLSWLPQETILFDGAALSRKIEINLAKGASFLAVESIVMGRMASIETVIDVHLKDNWNVWQDGKLVYAERMNIGGVPPSTAATLGTAKAFATVLFISDVADRLGPKLQKDIGVNGGISAWNGKLVARLVAEDGFRLRKSLKTVLLACLIGKALPRTWQM